MHSFGVPLCAVTYRLPVVFQQSPSADTAKMNESSGTKGQRSRPLETGDSRIPMKIATPPRGVRASALPPGFRPARSE